MPIGTSTGKTYDDQFEQVADMHGLLPTDPMATPKEGQTVARPVISTSQAAKDIVSGAQETLLPSLTPMSDEESTRRLRAFQDAKPGDKVPELEKPGSMALAQGATDAIGLLPVGGAATGTKLAMAGIPGIKSLVKGAVPESAYAALDTEMKALLKDTITTNKFKEMAPNKWYKSDKIDIKAEWDAFNKKYDAAQAAKNAEETAGIFGVAKSYVQSMKDKVTAFEQKLNKTIGEGLKNKYAEHLEPVDWQSVKSPLMGKQYETEENETVKRARELGFNVDFPLFKGGHSPPSKFESVPDPTKKTYERGIFYSDQYEIADSYAPEKDHVGTYVARAPNALTVDWVKATGYKNYDPDYMGPLIEAAREKQADMLIVKNLKDVGGKQDQYVVLNPAIVRRPDAEFHPDKLHLNHLLASTGAFGVVAHEGLKQEK